MMAPLYDNKGTIRHFIGCQVHITKLVEGGRGLESFQRLLTQSPTDSFVNDPGPKSSLKALSELGCMFNDEEIEAVKQRAKDPIDSGRSTPVPPTALRGFVGMDDASETIFWPPSHFSPSGRLLGVYQKVSTPLLPQPLRM